MPELVTNACKFLESLQRFDLSMLLAQCNVAIRDRRGFQIDDEWFANAVGKIVSVQAPAPISEALVALPPQDRKRIAEAVASGAVESPMTEDIDVEQSHDVSGSGAASLLAELLVQRALMISVATGGDRIEDVNDYYRARDVRIRQALPEDVTYDNPHKSLWDWYHYWSANLPQYRDRRQYIRELFGPAIDAVSMRSTIPTLRRAITGWERVDRALSKARSQLERSSAEEDFQAVGLLCREVLISLAQAVYDPAQHPTLDGVEASPTDAGRMLEGYVSAVFPGSSNKEVRAHARASLALALNLQHRRTATRQLASLCLEATASTAAVVSIIARPA